MEDSLKAVQNEQLLEELYELFECEEVDNSPWNWEPGDAIHAAAEAYYRLQEWKQQ